MPKSTKKKTPQKAPPKGVSPGPLADEIRDQTRILLLPEAKLETDNCRVVSFVKAARQYGGDWWGWTEIKRKGKPPLLLLMIGDATGHGAPAALVAGTVRGALSVISSWATKDLEFAADPREILKILNRVVRDASQGSIVMTLSVVIFDSTLGEIRTANAGHNFPYVLSPTSTGTIELKALGQGGVPLGHSYDTEYRDMGTYPWVKGSKLFLYTDGLTENYKGDVNLFDRRKLQKFLKMHGQLMAQELLELLVMERDQVLRNVPQADDVTVVICEMKG